MNKSKSKLFSTVAPTLMGYAGNAETECKNWCRSITLPLKANT